MPKSLSCSFPDLYSVPLPCKYEVVSNLEILSNPLTNKSIYISLFVWHYQVRNNFIRNVWLATSYKQFICTSEIEYETKLNTFDRPLVCIWINSCIIDVVGESSYDESRINVNAFLTGKRTFQNQNVQKDDYIPYRNSLYQAKKNSYHYYYYLCIMQVNINIIYIP